MVKFYTKKLEDWGFKLVHSDTEMLIFTKELFVFTVYYKKDIAYLQFKDKLVKSGDFNPVIEKYIDICVNQTLFSEEFKKLAKMLLTMGRVYHKEGRVITVYNELMETMDKFDEIIGNSDNNP